MKVQSLRRGLWLGVALLALGGTTVGSLSGCSVIQRQLPPPPDEEIAPAVIRARSLLRREKGDTVSIKAIDNLPPTLLEYKWVVTPGPHRLEIEAEFYEDSTQVRDRTYVTKVKKDLDMTAVPGAEYVVDAVRDHGTVYVWVAELQTGQVVAGDAPHGNSLRGFDRRLEN